MRRTPSFLAALATAGLLAACAQPPTQPAPSPAPAPSTGSCNAAGAQFAIGQVATANLVEQARQRAGAEMARTLRPGQVVTMEYNGSRLNLRVDEAHRVVGVTCG